MKFDPEMQIVKKQLEDLEHEVQKPNVVEGHVYEDNLDENAALKRGFIDQHFRKIDESEAIVVVNPEKNGVPNYIGGNSLIEIAYAYSQGLDIFILHGIPDVSYADEIRGMNPIVLDGSIKKLDEHIKALPLVFMSTESPVKHLAVSRGLRRAGIRTQVGGTKIESGVSEQPFSVEETYYGAVNRHTALKKAAPPETEYLVTIESGQHRPHKDHGTFGCSVSIIEPREGERKIGIDFDIEFPKEMTDKVPSVYPDLGALVQAEYGAIVKDPFPYFTNNKLTRVKILENAIYNMAVQL
jgi:non-canonical (house-cleaning) NTP pyrophosphatase